LLNERLLGLDRRHDRPTGAAEDGKERVALPIDLYPFVPSDR
jgi:hypothetical protein